MNFKSLFLLVLLFGFGNQIQAREPLTFSLETSLYPLHDHMEIFSESDDLTEPAQIPFEKGFVPYRQKDSWEMSAQVFWIRFSIHNQLANPYSLFLNSAYFDSVKVYSLSESSPTLQHQGTSGFMLPPKTPFTQVYRTSFAPIQLDPQSANTFYIQLFADSRRSNFFNVISFSEGFDLYSAPEIRSKFYQQRDWGFLFSGLLLAMFFFNFLMALRGKRKEYFWLAAYNLVFCLVNLNSFGFTASSGLIESPELIRTLHYALPSVLALFYCLFSIYFLEIPKQSPLIFKIIIGLNALILGTIILVSLGNFSLSFFIFAALPPIELLLILYVCWKNIKENHYRKPMYFYLLGSGIMLIFFVNYIFSIANEDLDYYSSEILFQFGSIVELMIYTFLTVERFINSQREVLTLETQKATLQSQKEQLEEEIGQKNKELVSRTTAELAFHQRQLEILGLLESGEQSAGPNLKMAIAKVKSLTDKSNFDENFLIHFNGVHIGFSDRLKTRHPKLSANDVKVCAYLRMNLSSQDIAQLQGVEKSSINQARYRIRKKMELDRETDLFTYLKEV